MGQETLVAIPIIVFLSFFFSVSLFFFLHTFIIQYWIALNCIGKNFFIYPSVIISCLATVRFCSVTTILKIVLAVDWARFLCCSDWFIYVATKIFLMLLCWCGNVVLCRDVRMFTLPTDFLCRYASVIMLLLYVANVNYSWRPYYIHFVLWILFHFLSYRGDLN